MGEKYNIGGGAERTNLEVVDRLCAALDDLLPPSRNPALGSAASYRALKTFVPDRPGHDRRYAIDSTRIRTQLGWAPSVSWEEGLRETVRWYVENESWWRAIKSGEYRHYYERQYGAA